MRFGHQTALQPSDTPICGEVENSLYSLQQRVHLIESSHNPPGKRSARAPFSRPYLADPLSTFRSPRSTAYVRKRRRPRTLLATTRLRVTDILKATSLKLNSIDSAGGHTFSPRQVLLLPLTLIHLRLPLEGNILQIVPGRLLSLSPICRWSIRHCLRLPLRARHPIIYPITYTPCSYKTSRILQRVATSHLLLPYLTPPRTPNHLHLLEVDPLLAHLPSHRGSNHDTRSPE
jgi:hypothetical protein